MSNAPGTFELLGKDGCARAGLLHTAHGAIETPIFMPVGTVGSVKALAPDDLDAIGAQIILGNTYHLYLRPGDELVARRGGLHEGLPRPGELVFFRDTADSNRDGRENDGLTHIGIVTGVDPGGTVHLVHRNSQGIVRERMNLSLPSRHTADSGDVLNDWLRGGARPRLMGELFVSYGRLAGP